MRIAIVGSGISGLTSGYLLSRKHDITVYEANDYLGGHTATVNVKIDDVELPIDTGFIVFNDRTYPNFLRMMEQINVKIKPTEMSFSVQNTIEDLEYNGKNLNTLFAQRKNLCNPRFLLLIREILKFNRLAKKRITGEKNEEIRTLNEFLRINRFSDFFSNNYILAMASAIWSSSIPEIKNLPLRFFLNFFHNHGLLEVLGRPQWYVIEGGSKSYVPELCKKIQNIRLGCSVLSVRRNSDRVDIFTPDGHESFDEVIFACHSDQALRILSDATRDERNILGSINYSDSEVILHTDDSFLPKQKRAHASWNYRLDPDLAGKPSVTYNMNILQGLDTRKAICVTLNQTDKIDPEEILGEFRYSHPIFNEKSVAAQKRCHDISGHNRTYFCGAYWHQGFHEDGVKSALDVCRHFRIGLSDMDGE